MSDVIVDFDRMTIQIEEPSSVGNSISFGPHYSGSEMLSVEIDNPWSGDTETGFGRTASMPITKEQAKQLAEFLARFAASPAAEPRRMRTRR